jgi:hypothetical protein
VAHAAGAWSFDRSSDPQTGETILAASTLYREGAITRGAVVRCSRRALDVYVELGEPLGSERSSVRYRSDKGDWKQAEWFVSPDGTAVYPRDKVEIARLWMRGARFVIEASDARGELRRAAFVLTGSSKPIRAVLEACGVPVGKP